MLELNPMRQRTSFSLSLIGIWVFFAGLAVFSFWLMFHTFSYDISQGQFLISGKAWSDFGGYLPQIRSFSYGRNWPPQYPLFPGEPTKYHFLFYLLVGRLEALGIPIHWALNIPSALGFFLLNCAIFFLSRRLFHSRAVALLSVILFLSNGSWSFLDFFKTHPLSDFTLSQLIHNSVFPSFGPWNGSEITAFWNLNIYTNQRHLGASYAVLIGIIYILYTRHRHLLYWVGFLVGSLMFLNQAAFAIALIFVGSFFILVPKIRMQLAISGFAAIPFLIASRLLINAEPAIKIKLGFLAQSESFISILRFWVLNIGVHFFLIPIGLVLSPKKARVFILPLAALFLIPNVFQLSPDMINNHKFFNFFLIIGGMFSAYALLRVWHRSKLGKSMAVLLTILGTLGGLFDLFPVINDTWYRIPDITTDPAAGFFYVNTPPDAVVLNSTWFYHPASIAGRFIYNGYPYFTWSFGYNQEEHESITQNIYSAPTKTEACRLLIREGINYVEISPTHERFIIPNWQMWLNDFDPVYFDPALNYRIFSVVKNCNEI